MIYLVLWYLGLCDSTGFCGGWGVKIPYSTITKLKNYQYTTHVLVLLTEKVWSLSILRLTLYPSSYHPVPRAISLKLTLVSAL